MTITETLEAAAKEVEAIKASGLFAEFNTVKTNPNTIKVGFELGYSRPQVQRMVAESNDRVAQMDRDFPGRFVVITGRF